MQSKFNMSDSHIQRFKFVRTYKVVVTTLQVLASSTYISVCTLYMVHIHTFVCVHTIHGAHTYICVCTLYMVHIHTFVCVHYTWCAYIHLCVYTLYMVHIHTYVTILQYSSTLLKGVERGIPSIYLIASSACG